MPSPINYRKLVLFVIFFILCIDLYYLFEFTESAINANRTLETDGFCCFQTKTREDERKQALQRLPKNYVFIDYEYIIQSTALSTFHRDVTSSKRLYDCLYPVYTLIVYEYEGDLLSVCPNSHQTWPFVWSSIVNIKGPKDTAILFNSEILHAGQTNKCAKRRVVRQYKICHLLDIPKLRHLEGIRANKTEKCYDNAWTQINRKLSFYFAHIINHWFYPFLMKKNGSNTWTGWIQSLFPYHQFYNNI